MKRKEIKLVPKNLILDVDGVFTDGKFYYTTEGKNLAMLTLMRCRSFEIKCTFMLLLEIKEVLRLLKKE